MVQSGGTLETGAKIAKLAGAKKISFFIVHDDFSPATFDYLNPLLEDGTIDKIYILETIPLVNKEKWHKNLIVISPEDLIVNVILTIHYEGHMRKLFLEI
jgi:phosphoribosylpyrophosphate synthetase